MAIVPATPYAAIPAASSPRSAPAPHAASPNAAPPQMARSAHQQPRIGSAVLAATLSIAFIGAMILAVETVVGMVLGSFLHSGTIGLIAVAVVGLPTLGWLAFVRLPIAIRAERDAY